MRIGAVRIVPFSLAVLLSHAILDAPSARAVTREVCGYGCFSVTIQAAIGASAPGDVVLVHDGTYREHLDFHGKAITVRSVNGAAATVIDGGGAGTVVNFVSGEGPRARLQGFTITRGSGGTWAGGIRSDGSSPRVVDCVITGNTGGSGGGVRIFGGAPSFTRCRIIANAASYGGGVSASESGATFTSCRIAGNTSTFGAGIACFGLTTRATPAPPEVSPRLVNCVVSGNSTTTPPGCAKYIGGGLAASISSPTVVNCTFSGNNADLGSSIGAFRSAVKVVNSIFWSEAGDPLHAGTDASFDVTYSDVQYGFPGRGNRGVIPEFVRPISTWDAPTSEGDFRLRRTSPCIDAGTGTGAPRTDLEGQRRPWGRRVDIGADEHFGGVDVCPEGCIWTSIQDALDQARPDDVILVGDGVYAERLRFPGRGVTVRSLSGPAAAIIDGGGAGSTVTFSTDVSSWGEQLSGFTVRGGGGTPLDGATWGGGILVEPGAFATVRGCRIAGNAADRGAGIAAVSGSYLTLDSSTVTGNRAAIDGGGLWLAGGWLREVTVAGNAAGSSGGGLFAAEAARVDARNSIFWGNAAAGAPSEVSAPTGDFVAAYCDIRDGWPGTVVLDADPLFAAPLAAEAAPTAGGDYHIRDGSPCIDAGEPRGWSAYPPYDIDGDPRAPEDRDIGADEHVRPGNLLRNASFEEGVPNPTGWTGSLLGATDRVYQGSGYDGTGWFRILGTRTAKRLSQTLAVPGSAGDSFTLSARTEAPSDLASLVGFAGVRVRFFHRDGTMRTVRIPAVATGMWSPAEATITALRAYRRIEVSLMNSTRGGDVGFDALRLARVTSSP